MTVEESVSDAPLPEGVSYLVIPAGPDPAMWLRKGEFPHAPMAHVEERSCNAVLAVHLSDPSLPLDDSTMVHDPFCTRWKSHEPPHVAHLVTGFPLAAWTDEEVDRG